MDKLGIVFSGGGARGAYQVGVWKALHELNILKNVISVAGTSMGAINATLFVQGDLELAIKMWANLKRNDIVKIDLPNVLKRKSLCSKDALRGFIDNHLDFKKIVSSEVKLYICSTEVTKIFDKSTGVIERVLSFPQHIHAQFFNVKTMQEKDFICAVIASCSLPVVFNTERFLHGIYYDGGFACRTPVQALQNDECDKIIVIHADNFEKIYYKYLLKQKNVIHIFPKKFQGGVWNGTYDFVGKNAIKRIEQGYYETIEKFSV